MTKATSLQMTDAVADLISGAGVSCSVGEAPANLSAPHCVVWPGAGFEMPTNLALPIGDLRLSFQLTAIGTTAEQAQWVSDTARVAINKVTPAPIADYTFWPIYAEPASQPVRRDDQVEPPLFVSTSRWVIRSQPS
jgi:hypothetical protein